MTLETVLNLLLIRFGLIAGALVVIALVVFAVALRFKRRGRLDQLRDRAAPLARGVANYLDNRPNSGQRGGSLTRSVARAAASYLEDAPRPPRPRHEDER